MPRDPVEPLGRALKATPLNVSAGPQSIPLDKATKRITFIAVGGPIRYEIKVADTLTADASTSHYLADGERMDLAIPPGTARFAAIKATGSSATAVEVTELS